MIVSATGTVAISLRVSTLLEVVADVVRSLRIAAVQLRRKILFMGHANHIKLHYSAIMSMVEIMTTLYGIWLKVDPRNPALPERLQRAAAR